MFIGNTELTHEMMPSFISPDKQPAHTYQSMQDTLNNALNRNQNMQQMQPNMQQNSMENRGNQWQQ